MYFGIPVVPHRFYDPMARTNRDSREVSFERARLGPRRKVTVPRFGSSLISSLAILRARFVPLRRSSSPTKELRGSRIHQTALDGRTVSRALVVAACAGTSFHATFPTSHVRFRSLRDDESIPPDPAEPRVRDQLHEETTD